VPPSTFLQLKQLAIVEQNITYADQTRKPPVSTVMVNVVESLPTTSTYKHYHTPLHKFSTQGKQVVCFIVGSWTFSETFFPSFSSVAQTCTDGGDTAMTRVENPKDCGCCDGITAANRGASRKIMFSRAA
jgi:hypothetical protein